MVECRKKRYTWFDAREHVKLERPHGLGWPKSLNRAWEAGTPLLPLRNQRSRTGYQPMNWQWASGVSGYQEFRASRKGLDKQGS